jgi:nucleoside triphosphatase
MFKNKKAEDDFKAKDKPSLIAGAFIVNNEGKILLARGKKFENKYTIAGGHIELGEKIEETLRRETKEETNLDIEVIEPISVEEEIFLKKYPGEEHLIFINYLCKYSGDGSDVKLADDEFDGDFVWAAPEEALKLKLAPKIDVLIKRYIEYFKNKDAINGWKRCQADFENYRKMQDESRKQLKEFVLEDLAMQILPVVDNFEMSLSHVPEGQKDGAWVQGILHIQRQLETVLKDNGVEEIETKIGDKFDPNFHEAVENHQEEGNEEHHKIKKIIGKGYRIGDKVIRATKVIVE